MSRKKEFVPAYLTVYLALTMGILVSLWAVLMEGARLGAIELETACLADACTDSVLAEYHRELFRRYNVLAVDSSYGSSTVGRANLEGRLVWYLHKNTSPKEFKGYLPGIAYADFLGIRLEGVELTEYAILSDDRGKVFRDLAVEAVLDDLGVTAAQEALSWLQTVKEYRLDERDVEKEKQAVDAQIATYQGKENKDHEKVTFESPTAKVDRQMKTGILRQTLGDKKLSSKRLYQSTLIGQRMKDGRQTTGNVPFQGGKNPGQLMGKALFGEYLLSYMSFWGKEKEENALDYEVEYALVGKETDAENLRGVLHRILAIREAANAVYLFSDQKKSDEADLVALALSTILGVPELQELFHATILFSWAYVESLYDLRTLIGGDGVPLMKDEKSWHYGLNAILSGLWENGHGNEKTDGLRYRDYLRILLLLENEEDLSRRAMDLVEANIRLTPGNKGFRMDGCYVKLKTRISVKSGFGHSLEIWEEKQY